MAADYVGASLTYISSLLCYCIVVNEIPWCKSDAASDDNTDKHTQDSATRSRTGHCLFVLSSDYCGSVKLLSTFQCSLKSELFVIVYSKRENSDWSLSLCTSDCLVGLIDLINSLIAYQCLCMCYLGFLPKRKYFFDIFCIINNVFLTFCCVGTH